MALVYPRWAKFGDTEDKAKKIEFNLDEKLTIRIFPFDLESSDSVLEHWLKNYLLAPLENDVFLVYNNGVGQWLKQHLAKNDSLGTAKLNGLNSTQWLNETLEKLPTWPYSRIDELLPLSPDALQKLNH